MANVENVGTQRAGSVVSFKELTPRQVDLLMYQICVASYEKKNEISRNHAIQC